MQSDSGVAPGPATTEQTGFAEARERLVARLGHEVRTPLSIVAASVELLGTDAGAHAAATRAQVLGNAVDRLRRLLDHLLAVSRWPTDDVIGGTSLEDAARHAVRVATADAAERGVEIDVDVATPVDVVAHGEVLAWALTALVERTVAATAAAGGGLVVVDVDRADADRADHDRGVATIRSQPRGNATPRDGTAAAVAPDVVADLAAEILTRSWGEVRVEPGTDPTTVVLPIVGSTLRPDPSRPERSERPRRPATSSPVPDPVGRDGAHLALVVEDDVTLRDFLTRTLSAEWRVVPVASAEQALDAATRHRPDIIVCDIMLPGIDGEELVHALQGLEPMAGVPIIVLTGRTDEALRVRLLRDGADDYLTKPFAVDELRVRMANLASEQLDVEELRRRAQQAETLADQLQHALESRVVIEQAKAFVAAALGLDVDEAFELIRKHARDNQARLHDVARSVVRTRRWPPR